MKFDYEPITDLSVPTFDDLVRVVNDVASRLQAGEKMYVHCWGGRGRAGTVASCVLAKVYGISAEEALTRVQRAFDTRMDGGRKSPETAGQVELVQKYVASLGQ